MAEHGAETDTTGLNLADVSLNQYIPTEGSDGLGNAHEREPLALRQQLVSAAEDIVNYDDVMDYDAAQAEHERDIGGQPPPRFIPGFLRSEANTDTTSVAIAGVSQMPDQSVVDILETYCPNTTASTIGISVGLRYTSTPAPGNAPRLDIEDLTAKPAPPAPNSQEPTLSPPDLECPTSVDVDVDPRMEPWEAFLAIFDPMAPPAMRCLPILGKWGFNIDTLAALVMANRDIPEEDLAKMAAIVRTIEEKRRAVQMDWLEQWIPAAAQESRATEQGDALTTDVDLDRPDLKNGKAAEETGPTRAHRFRRQPTAKSEGLRYAHLVSWDDPQIADVLGYSGEVEETSASDDSEGYHDETSLKPTKKRDAKARRTRAALKIVKGSNFAPGVDAPIPATRKPGPRQESMSTTAHVSHNPNALGVAETLNSKDSMDAQKRKRFTLVGSSLAQMPWIPARALAQAKKMADRRTQRQNIPRPQFEMINSRGARQGVTVSNQPTFQNAAQRQRPPPEHYQNVLQHTHCRQPTQTEPVRAQGHAQTPHTHIHRERLLIGPNTKHGDSFPGEYPTPGTAVYQGSNSSNPRPSGIPGCPIPSEDQREVNTEPHPRPPHGSPAVSFSPPAYYVGHYQNATGMQVPGPVLFNQPGGSSRSSNEAVVYVANMRFSEIQAGQCCDGNHTGQPPQPEYQHEWNSNFSPQEGVYEAPLLVPHTNGARTPIWNQEFPPQYVGVLAQSPVHRLQGSSTQSPYGGGTPTSGYSGSNIAPAARGWQDAHRNRFSGMHPGQIQAVLAEEERLNSTRRSQQAREGTIFKSPRTSTTREGTAADGQTGTGNQQAAISPPPAQPTLSGTAPTPPLNLPSPQQSPPGANTQELATEASSSEDKTSSSPPKRRLDGVPKSAHEPRITKTWNGRGIASIDGYYHCISCTMVFADGSVARSHVKREHPAKRFGCPLCTRRFLTPAQRYVHVRGKHPGVPASINE